MAGGRPSHAARSTYEYGMAPERGGSHWREKPVGHTSSRRRLRGWPSGVALTQPPTAGTRSPVRARASRHHRYDAPLVRFPTCRHTARQPPNLEALAHVVRFLVWCTLGSWCSARSIHGTGRCASGSWYGAPPRGYVTPPRGTGTACFEHRSKSGQTLVKLL